MTSFELTSKQDGNRRWVKIKIIYTDMKKMYFVDLCRSNVVLMRFFAVVVWKDESLVYNKNKTVWTGKNEQKSLRNP